MPRPKTPRCLNFRPGITYFKPRGIPLHDLTTVTLDPDELEAIHLADYLGENQLSAATSMQISQSTFARIIGSAHRKIAEALIKGMAISINSLVK